MKLHLVQGDITVMAVDAIVNAANNLLLGGGGVDGAIHRAGGLQITAECKRIREAEGGCPTGKAVITNAGNLKAKKIIHTVGPVWKGGFSQEEQELSNCYKNSLMLAEEYRLLSIAFPNISTGIYGFPKRTAAKVAVDSVINFKSNTIKEVYFVCYDQENYDIYQKLLL